MSLDTTLRFEEHNDRVPGIPVSPVPVFTTVSVIKGSPKRVVFPCRNWRIVRIPRRVRRPRWNSRGNIRRVRISMTVIRGNITAMTLLRTTQMAICTPIVWTIRVFILPMVRVSTKAVVMPPGESVGIRRTTDELENGICYGRNNTHHPY